MSIGSWSYEWAKQQQLNSDWLEQTQSTQFWAKQMLEFKIPEHVNYSLRQENKKYVGAFEKVYFTDTQTAGRGQGTNSWTNPDIGTSLLSTWVFDLNISPPPFITLKVGLALIRACTTTWPQLRWSLKAQNDLLLQDKKVAGLLLETISQGSSYKLLIGLGFNIHNKPNNLAEATALTDHLGRSCTQAEWEQFLSRLFIEFQFLFLNDPSAHPSPFQAQSYDNSHQVNKNNFKFIISPEEKESLIYYLNRNPKLINQCIDITENGVIIWP